MDFRNGLPEVENILSFTIETLDEEVLIVKAVTDYLQKVSWLSMTIIISMCISLFNNVK